MYEAVTFEVILKRMLQRVIDANPNIDIREGSIIYNACAPAAVELQNMYIELDWILKQTFADTAARDYLILRAKERGVYVEAATKAIRQGEFNLDVPIGSRFSLNQLNYVVLEKVSDGIFRMECETPGYLGNIESGRLVPIDYIDGLTTAQLTAVLIPGEDEEGVEQLRQRYFDSLEGLAFGGNIKDYQTKVNAINGVGGVKVYPVWNGGGTVKLVVIDSTFSVPSTVLIDEVQTAIDPIQNQGAGVGIAPIGHVVTVDGVEETTVNITTEITYESGWNWTSLAPYANAAIDAYFKELAQDWSNQPALIVRISQIETRLLDLQGVLDIGNTTLNGAAQNLSLGENNIPFRGTVIPSG